MSDEYKDNKIEAKSADSSSGGYAQIGRAHV